jgi:hypothetical protein
MTGAVKPIGNGGAVSPTTLSAGTRGIEDERLRSVVLATAAGNRLQRAVSRDAPAAVLGEVRGAADQRSGDRQRASKQRSVA